MAKRSAKFTISWMRVALYVAGAFVLGLLASRTEQWFGWHPLWVMLIGTACLWAILKPLRFQTNEQSARSDEASGAE